MNLKTSVSFAALVALFSGCAAYTVNNERFSNVDDAIAAVKRAQDELLKGLGMREAPLDAKVLVLTPSREACIKKALPASTASKAAEFNGGTLEQSFSVYARALKQSQAFSVVEARIVEQTESLAVSEAKNYSAVIYMHLIAPGQSGWLLIKNGDDKPRPVALDPLLKPGPQKFNSWIDNAVTAYLK